MAIARRALFGLGAAFSICAVTSSCRDDARDTLRPTRRRTTSATRPARTPTFPGQPPVGALYYGASLPRDRSLTGWEKELGSPLSLNRSYFTPDHNEVAQLVNRCREDLAVSAAGIAASPAYVYEDPSC